MEAKTIGIFIIGGSILLFLFTEIKKRRVLQSLVKHYEQGEYDEYFTLLESPFVKWIYPIYNRNYMKLNAYLMLEDNKEAERLFETMLKMRTTKKQRIDLVNKAFHYYVEQNDKDHAKQMLKEIETFEDTNLILESKTIYDVIILKKFSYIEEMEQRLKQAEDIQKGFLEYLLSLQYGNKGDKEKEAYYFELAQNDIISKK